MKVDFEPVDGTHPPDRTEDEEAAAQAHKRITELASGLEQMAESSTRVSEEMRRYQQEATQGMTELTSRLILSEEDLMSTAWVRNDIKEVTRTIEKNLEYNARKDASIRGLFIPPSERGTMTVQRDFASMRYMFEYRINAFPVRESTSSERAYRGMPSWTDTDDVREERKTPPAWSVFNQPTRKKGRDRK